MSKRPLSITLIGWTFIGVGCVSLVAGVSRFIGDLGHARTWAAHEHDLLDLALVSCSGLLAVVGGAFVLRGRTWARLVCAAWLGFHVLSSIVHAISELVVHSLLFAGISYFLFRRQAGAFFQTTSAR